MNISWDLEATPLKIKTDSTMGSNDQIWVVMYDKDGSYISAVVLVFSSPDNRYQIIPCSSLTLTDLPVQPPKEVGKVWAITKTENALLISCNGVEVLNYLFADSSDSKCVTSWGGDVVDQIKFVGTASDFYRAGKGLNVIYTTRKWGERTDRKSREKSIP